MSFHMQRVIQRPTHSLREYHSLVWLFPLLIQFSSPSSFPIESSMDRDIDCSAYRYAAHWIVFHELAQLLDLQLDKKTLVTLYNLVDSGVNPDSLVAILQELKRKP